MKEIVLASTSPQRRDLLGQLNIPFSIHPSHYEEVMTDDLLPDQLVVKLSLGKALDVAKSCPNSIIIGADTIVYFQGKNIGKPKDNNDARRILTAFNGQEHEVWTGYTIIDTDTNKTISTAVVTKVLFKKLSPEQIDAYIKTGDPIGKAGAYGIQSVGGDLVASINGEFANVIGLPIESLRQTLKQEFGIFSP